MLNNTAFTQNILLNDQDVTAPMRVVVKRYNETMNGTVTIRHARFQTAGAIGFMQGLDGQFIESINLPTAAGQRSLEFVYSTQGYWELVSNSGGTTATGANADAAQLTTGILPDARLSNVGTATTKGSTTQIPVIVTDSKGRITSLTSVPVAVTGGTQGNAVTNMTSSGVQTAIDNAAAGSTIELAGTYNFTDRITLNKAVNLVAPLGATLDGGTATDGILKINNYAGGQINNILFKSQKTTGQYGLILINEEQPVTNLLFDKCKFTCPNGDYNAVSAVAYSEVTNLGVVHKNIRFNNCDVYDVGRMGLEFINHESTSGSLFRFQELAVTNCRFVNLGIVSVFGMGTSFSGHIRGVRSIGNSFIDVRAHAQEFIGTNNFVSANNIISTQKTWTDSGNTLQTNAYNITDGFRPGRGAKHGSITGDQITVNGRPAVVYTSNHIAFNGGEWITGLTTHIKSNHVTFSGVKHESLLEYCILLESSNDCSIFGGQFSTINAGTRWAQINMIGNSNRNFVQGVHLLGDTMNGTGMQVRNEGSGTGNKWVNCYHNGNLLNN